MKVEDIQPKEDYPDKVDQTAHIEEKFKLNADEINAMVEALKILDSTNADPFANYEQSKK